MQYLHQIFNKFRSIFKHKMTIYKQASSKSNVSSDIKRYIFLKIVY